VRVFTCYGGSLSLSVLSLRPRLNRSAEIKTQRLGTSYMIPYNVPIYIYLPYFLLDLVVVAAVRVVAVVRAVAV